MDKTVNSKVHLKESIFGGKKIWKAINTEEFPHLEQFCIFYTAGESVELETGN